MFARNIYRHYTLNYHCFVINMMNPKYLKVVHRPFIIMLLILQTFTAETAHNFHPWIAKSSYLTISHINHTHKMVINKLNREGYFLHVLHYFEWLYVFVCAYQHLDGLWTFRRACNLLQNTNIYFIKYLHFRKSTAGVPCHRINGKIQN